MRSARDPSPRRATTTTCPSSATTSRWLDEDLRRGDFDHGSFGSLGLALGDLRAHPSLAELATNHGVHQAIRRVDQLRADYADLTRERPVEKRATAAQDDMVASA